MYQTQKHIAFSFDLNNSIEGKLNVCDSNSEKIVSWEKSIIFTIYIRTSALVIRLGLRFNFFKKNLK